MSWAGTAISSSSRPAPALATLLTGLSPWNHQVLDAPTRLDAGLWTLAEALRAAGYATTAFREVSVGRGWAQGFDQYRELGQLHRAKQHLSELQAAPSFTWVHLETLGGPFVRHDRFLKRIGQLPPELPARLGAAARARRIAGDPSPQERARLWALYRLNVAAVDETLGILIAALESSGQWNRSVVAVVGTQGLALGEAVVPGAAGSVGISGLARSELETPLMLKLPAASPPVAVAPGGRVALARLWSTLVESAGGSAPAAVAPSLLREAPAGALSELYAEAGSNRFSWVEGEAQLLRLVPAGGGARGGGPRGAGFRSPFDGSGPARLQLLRWTPNGVEEMPGHQQHDELLGRLASAMEREFTFFSERESGLAVATDLPAEGTDAVAAPAPPGR